MQRQKLKADTASGVKRMRNILFIRFMKNKVPFRLRFKVDARPTADELELEGIPMTIDDRTFRFIVPHLHTFTLAWDQLMSFAELDSDTSSSPGGDSTPNSSPFSS